MFDLFGRITGQIRAAMQDFNMIQSGDRLALGLSGGKDSLVLLTALADLRRYYPVPFELEAITVDLGFDNGTNNVGAGDDTHTGTVAHAGTVISAGDGISIDAVIGADAGISTGILSLTAYCESLSVRHTVEQTQIGKIIFQYKEGEGPCSLCANMRRGALNSKAVSLGCNKVVLAHNMDDVIETMLLSLFYEGRISTFSPVTYLDRKRLTVLRPLIYTQEKDIITYVEQTAPFSTVKNPCPMDGNTQRQSVKEVLKELSRQNRHIRSNIFGAIKRCLF
jgi:tRNA(Ile)-lysidine synthase TilS/MesJ